MNARSSGLTGKRVPLATVRGSSVRSREQCGETQVLALIGEHPRSTKLVPNARPVRGSDLRFGVGIHETILRVNVRWVTPLGEETASTS